MSSKPKIAILGTGLIGASLGRALRRKGWRVAGYDPSRAARSSAKRLGAVDAAFGDLETALRGARIVLLAAPPEASLTLLGRVWELVAPGTVITDAVSVKAPIAAKARRLRRKTPGPIFIGGHPIAGSERSGAAASRARLFDGAACALIREPGQPAWARKLVAGLWRQAGARPVWLTAKEHDRRIAGTSHFPHLLAAALCAALAPAARGKRAGTLAGPAFRDLSRLAASDPRLWSEICRANAAELRRASSAFLRSLKAFFRDAFAPKRFRLAAKTRRRLLARN